jgi:hypothetical protein
MKILKSPCQAPDKIMNPFEHIISQAVDKLSDNYEVPKTKSLFQRNNILIPLEHVSAQFREPIYNINPLGGGDNFVYLINNFWVFRVPKNYAAKQANQSEQILLEELSKKVKSTSIPHYTFWDHKTGIGGYQEIPGIALSKLFNKFNDSQKMDLAHDLARALSEIHSVSVKKNSFLQNHEPTAHEFFRRLRVALSYPSIFSHEESRMLNIALQKAEIFMKTPIFSPVVLHSDLHADNIIIDSKKNHLNGIIDFSDARIGAPIVDFCKIYRVSPSLAENAARKYAQIRNLDESLFLQGCRAWACVWHAAQVAHNQNSDSFQTRKRLIRAARVLKYLLTAST